jgi:hypothetical protein
MVAILFDDIPVSLVPAMQAQRFNELQEGCCKGSFSMAAFGDF